MPIEPATPAHLVEAMYVSHHRWLLARLRNKLGNHHDAADLMQTTFLHLLTAPELDRIQEPRAYLTTVAQRLLANHLRRNAIERAYMDALALVPQASYPSAESQAITLEALIQVDRLLAGLPLQAKQAFLMAQVDGLKHAEIAERLSISIATVKRRILQAAQQCYFADLQP